MHANLPDIANRWEAKYGLGGIAELNSQLNSLPEYYLPKNQGGRIGFAEGPKIPEKFLEDLKRKNYYKLLEEYRRWKEDYDRRKDLGVTQEAAHGGRIGFAEGPKTYEAWLDYRIKEIAAQRIPVPFKEWKKGDIKMNQGGFIPSHEAGIYGLAEGGQLVKPGPGRPGYGGPHETEAAGKTSSTSGSTGGEGGWHPGVSHSGTPTTTTTTTRADFDFGPDQEEDVARMMKDMGITPDHSPDYGGGWVEAETDYGAGDYSTKSDRAYDFDFMYGHKVKPKDQWTEHNKRNAWIEKKQLGKEMFDAFKFGVGPMSMIKFAWGQNKKKKAEKEHLQKMIDRMKKEGDDQFNPHMDSPLQIAEQLMIDLNTPKKQPDQDNRGDGVTGVASITYDDIEDTNKKELASSRWRQEQEKVDRSKQMAYWRMMMAPYMSAQGGRVPAGYNTGGLSNLFRLKNR